MSVQPARRRTVASGLALAVLTMLASVFALPAAPAHAAANYHVDCSASSNGSGSEASPWNRLSTVSNRTFGPGDKVLFKRGTTCNGRLAPKGSGAAGSPIVIDTYGTGAKPHIKGNGGPEAVRLHNQQYWEIRNLEVTNEGASNANRRGVYISLEDVGTGTYYRLVNLTVHNVNGDGSKDLGGSSGIHFDVLGSSVKTKFDDVILDGNEVYSVDRSGINMSTSWKCRAAIGWDGECSSKVDNYYPWTRFVARNNTVHDIGGDGIVLQYTDHGLAEYNVAYDTAMRPHRNNAAMWAWNADNVTFQFNEVYRTRKLPDNNDGTAWDADYGTDGTIFQYNYSHDNEGGMVLFCGCPGASVNAVIRYNVSQNDKHRIIFGAGAENGKFYNNTIYLEPGSTTKIIELDKEYRTQINLSNNIIVNAGSGGYDHNSELSFNNNILYGNHPGGPSGQITADPELTAPGTGSTGLGSLGGYELEGDSPALGAGVVISDNGGRDFWGNQVPADCAPDIGAHQRTTAGSCGGGEAGPSEGETLSLVAGRGREDQGGWVLVAVGGGAAAATALGLLLIRLRTRRIR